MTSPLGALLTPEAVAPFLKKSWPEHHGVTHGPLSRLPAFFQSPLLSHPRELARAYRGSVSITNLGVAQYPVAAGPSPEAYFEDLGLSVKFDDVENLLPGAKPWLRDLELELGVPRGRSRMVAFANAPGSGLLVHCDPSEQFAIHLVGEKRFRVKPSPIRFQSMSHSPHTHVKGDTISQSPDGLPTFKNLARAGRSYRLKPGSVLFTPRGLYHETLAAKGVSLTLVIAVDNPTPASLVSTYLQRYLMQSPKWRKPVRHAWATDVNQQKAGRAELKALVQSLRTELDQLDVDLMLADHEPTALLVRDCHPKARFQRDPLARVLLTNSIDASVEVNVARTVRTAAAAQRFPRELRGVFEWVLTSKSAFSLEALGRRFPQWSEPLLAAVLVFLVRCRVLVFLPFQPNVRVGGRLT